MTQDKKKKNNKIKGGNANAKSRSRKSAGKKKAAEQKVSLKQQILDFFGEKLKFIVSMLILVVAVFILLSLVSYVLNGHIDQASVEGVYGNQVEAQNWCGKLGARTANYFLSDCFGLSSIFIPIFLVLMSMRLLEAYGVRLWKWFMNFSLIMVWSSIALTYVTHRLGLSMDIVQKLPFPWGGNHGEVMENYLHENVGDLTTFVILALCLVFYFVYLTQETINIIRKLFRPQDMWKKKDEEEELEESDDFDAEDDGAEEPTPEDSIPTIIDFDNGDNVLDLGEVTPEEGEIQTVSPEAETPEAGESDFTIEVASETEMGDGNPQGDTEELAPYDPREDLPRYKFPTTDLLDNHGASTSVSVDMEEQKANKNRIIEVLHNFGVEITSIKATVGPTITLYEITPAPGVRISKIRNLEDDIALSLSANGIRIIAPIPGKGTIGIEVPNAKAQIVSMESLINSRSFQETKYELPIALGKTITNDVYMVDLAKLPHLLVAGATGQGKSVGLNAIIGSLLYKKHPAELKFVMVDPKKVEFSIYAPLLNHFLAAIPDNDEPIITDVHKVVRTLKSLCVEMDTRYDLLKVAKCKNVKEYNAKFKARQLNPNNGHRFMPYIVVIIDEFGDLIMTAGKEVELPIARIAQLARAVGIHMVIATQRPTTTIITGNIKANFPGRMAFKVMQRIDSQTILDRTGANQLVGRGDMLFLAGAEPVRVQCAFLDTPEVERISEYIGDQQGYFAPYELPEPPADDNASGGISVDEKLDEMFVEVAQWVVASQQGSTSAIQRKFSIGYNRAGRLMDQLEAAGVVGPARGAKPRDVLMQDDQQLQTIVEMMNAR